MKVISTQHTTDIETVLVTTGGRMLDCVSFATRTEADSYKRGVRRWARDRGLTVQIVSQVRDFANSPRYQEGAFALAS
jgi:hypothetical protein